MKRFRKAMIAIAILLGSISIPASAQIYVTIRPSRPVFVRPVAPGPGYIWIEEDWNGIGDRYEWRGGYWAAPPSPGYYYTPGHWRHTARGHIWIRGDWHGKGSIRGKGHKYNKGHGHRHRQGDKPKYRK